MKIEIKEIIDKERPGKYPNGFVITTYCEKGSPMEAMFINSKENLAKLRDLITEELGEEKGSKKYIQEPQGWTVPNYGQPLTEGEGEKKSEFRLHCKNCISLGADVTYHCDCKCHEKPQQEGEGEEKGCRDCLCVDEVSDWCKGDS